MSASKNDDHPSITPLENGPLRYDFQPSDGPVGWLYDSSGTKIPIPSESSACLCRCGGSACKPFCDGAHAQNGFDSSKTSDGRLDKREEYAGQEITVHDNRGICAHVGYCTDELPSVFHLRHDPWIDPDGAPPEKVARQTARCPSGALSHSLDGVERRDHDQESSITVSKNGPYFVAGWIDVVDEPRGEGASLEHCTLCRCGASGNKPFCDGSHWNTGFEDPDN